MSDMEFKLPTVGLDSLEKVTMAYAQLGERATTDAVASTAGVNKDDVGRNAQFLISTGILAGNRLERRATELGTELGRALMIDQGDTVNACYRRVVEGTEPLSQVVTTVRVQRGMKRDAVVKALIFDTKSADSGRAQRGAGAVIDLLVRAGFLEEEGDILNVSKTPETARVVDEPTADVGPGVSRGDADPADGAAPDGPTPPLPRRTPTPVYQTVARDASGVAVTINIELEIPATNDAQVYENLFAALRKNLLDPPTSKGTEDSGEE